MLIVPNFCVHINSTEASSGSHTLALDATVIDVYKGTKLAIFVINPYSTESLDYAENLGASVPAGIPILFLLNFRDAVKVYEHDPQPNSFLRADEYLAQKKGSVVSMEHVQAVVDKVFFFSPFPFFKC